MIKLIFCIFCLLLFPVTAFSAAISLPHYESYESRSIDSDINDGNCLGWDTNDSRDNCWAQVKDTYTARYGDNYAQYGCQWYAKAANDPLDDDSARIDSVWEGWRDPSGDYGCNELNVNDGSEYWVGWSVYIPEGYEVERYAHMLAQLHTNDEVTLSISYGSSVQGMRVKNRVWDPIEEESDQYTVEFLDWEAYKGQWIDLVAHWRLYHEDNANATMELYANGIKVQDRNGKANVGIVDGADDQLPVFYFNCYSWAYLQVSGYTASEASFQYDTDHIRETNFDEFRFYEQIGGSGDSNYCDVAPPIWAAIPTVDALGDNVPTNFTLTYSGYVDHRDDLQNCFDRTTTQIQIDEQGGDWSSLVYDSSTAGETSQAIAGLSPGVQYQVRVRHIGDRQ